MTNFSCDFTGYFNTVYILSHRCVQNKDYPPTSFDATQQLLLKYSRQITHNRGTYDRNLFTAYSMMPPARQTAQRLKWGFSRNNELKMVWKDEAVAWLEVPAEESDKTLKKKKKPLPGYPTSRLEPRPFRGWSSYANHLFIAASNWKTS
jgi:hypothetical protein